MCVRVRLRLRAWYVVCLCCFGVLVYLIRFGFVLCAVGLCVVGVCCVCACVLCVLFVFCCVCVCVGVVCWYDCVACLCVFAFVVVVVFVVVL